MRFPTPLRGLLLIGVSLSPLLGGGANAADAAGDAGRIAWLDPTRNLVALTDDKVFRAPPDWPFADYEVGDEVVVNYETLRGRLAAIRITFKDDAGPQG